MFIKREDLEARAKDCCPPDLWYELMDVIDDVPDSELLKLIEENENMDEKL